MFITTNGRRCWDKDPSAVITREYAVINPLYGHDTKVSADSIVANAHCKRPMILAINVLFGNRH